MSLQNKYKELIDTATAAGVANLQVTEQNGVLYIDGDAPTAAIKDQLWHIYDKTDPNFLSGDLVLNVNARAEAGSKVKVTTEKSNLNIRKGPGTDQPIIGKAAHGEIITLVSKSSELWWLVRTDDGEEGYAFAQYLTPEG
ncbi:MAG TPA: SH3 domain-containing protein [Ferruginibacter sp.]|nr:SH3 domain-containing protein [Ferruginibacter sp.]HMP21280.1 SH3 domain-containing protein [Ferruginibacter sp.]